MITISEMYVKRIEADIRGIRFRTKNPQDLNTLSVLEKLKVVNLPMYEDLLDRYDKVKQDYNRFTNETKQGKSY